MSIFAKLQHCQLFQSFSFLKTLSFNCVWIGTGSQLESDSVKKAFYDPDLKSDRHPAKFKRTKLRK